MSAEYVSNLLRKWRMPDEFIDKFKENEIDEAALLRPPTEIIPSLIVKVGPCIKFQDLLEQYTLRDNTNLEKNSPQEDTSTSCEFPQEKKRLIEDPSSSLQYIDICSISATELENVDIVTHGGSTDDKTFEKLLNPNERQSLPLRPSDPNIFVERNSRLQSHSHTEEYNFNEILSSTTAGVFTLKYLEMHKKSDDPHRNIIAQCLIDYELNDDLNKQITGARAKFIAEKVVEFFNVNGKTETEVTWYNPKKKSFKGKLIGRYHNVRRKLIKQKVIQKKSKDDALEIEFVDDDEETLNLLLWLKNNIAPWSKVLDFWRKTTEQRIRLLHSQSEPVYKSIGAYLPLKGSQALSLFEIDFENLYPEKALNLYNDFRKFVLSVDEKLKQKKVKESVSLTLLSGDLQILHLFAKIHFLFLVITCSTTKSKNWRPSRKEIKDGFLLKVNTFADIKPALILRRAKLARFSLSLQPQPVIVGTDLSNMTEQYVFVDDSLYPVESLLKTIDLTFKSVHALHARYAPEAEPIWLFLQIAVYRLRTKWDRKLAAVETLVEE